MKLESMKVCTQTVKYPEVCSGRITVHPVVASAVVSKCCPLNSDVLLQLVFCQSSRILCSQARRLLFQYNSLNVVNVEAD